MNNLKRVFPVFAALAMMFVMNFSQATTLTFENISNNSTVQLADQLSVDVNSVGTGVAFTFYNNVTIGSSITDIYFDTGDGADLFSSFAISAESAGVAFDLNPSPNNLPGGNTVGFYSDFGGDSLAPTSANGVDAAGEYITFLGTLGAGFSYADTLAAIIDGSFRVGMHLQSIDGGGANDSDSYINVVPVPAAVWLFGTALLGFFVTTLRQKKTI